VRLVARLRHLTGGAEVEHVGSTAVPGLRARDVVDLQVTVADRAAVQALEPALSAGGFPRRRDVTGDHVRAHPDPVAWRRHVHLSADPGRAADVHVRVAGSTSARASLALRDRLRADARAREEYAALKTQLAERHADDVDAYAEGKSELVVRLTAQALGG
jgi:dephospho-CoA kinase